MPGCSWELRVSTAHAHCGPRHVPIQTVVCIRLLFAVGFDDVQCRRVMRHYDTLLFGVLLSTALDVPMAGRRARYLLQSSEKTSQSRQLPCTNVSIIDNEPDLACKPTTEGNVFNLSPFWQQSECLLDSIALDDVDTLLRLQLRFISSRLEENGAIADLREHVDQSERLCR